MGLLVCGLWCGGCGDGRVQVVGCVGRDDGTGMDEGREGGAREGGLTDMRGACDVAVNDIGAEGGAKVAEALTMNSTLTHLDLRGENGWWDGGRKGMGRW